MQKSLCTLTLAIAPLGRRARCHGMPEDRQMKQGFTFNDILAFALEMAALALWGLWAASLAGPPIWRWALGLLAAAAFITLWALFFARTAGARLRMPWLLVGKLLLLLPPGLLYFGAGKPQGYIWAALVLVHLLTGADGKKL